MIVNQYCAGGLGHASYLIADEHSKLAVVVDPQLDVNPYLADAHALGVAIRGTLLTHLHADFVGGHLELRDRVGSPVYLGAQARVRYGHTTLHEGETLQFGNVQLRILETPGHTPEHIAILAFDRTWSEVFPRAAFTGDALFAIGAGRPLLYGSGGLPTEELRSKVFTSMQKLLRLPDETRVYPTHVTGSLCIEGPGLEPGSTIADQRRRLAAMRPLGRQTFVEALLGAPPEVPRCFEHDRLMNSLDRPRRNP